MVPQDTEQAVRITPAGARTARDRVINCAQAIIRLFAELGKVLERFRPDRPEPVRKSEEPLDRTALCDQFSRQLADIEMHWQKASPTVEKLRAFYEAARCGPFKLCSQHESTAHHTLMAAAEVIIYGCLETRFDLSPEDYDRLYPADDPPCQEGSALTHRRTQIAHLPKLVEMLANLLPFREETVRELIAAARRECAEACRALRRAPVGGAVPRQRESRSTPTTKQADALKLRWHGLTFEKIGKQLGISKQAAQKRYKGADAVVRSQRQRSVRPKRHLSRDGDPGQPYVNPHRQPDEQTFVDGIR
jgi:hypothetical protein